MQTVERMDENPCLVAWLFALGCLCAAGCGDSPGEAKESLRLLGTLPGLRATTNEDLRAELKHLENTGATPEDLAARLVPDETNVAVAIEGLFEPRQAADLLVRLESILPERGFRPHPTHRGESRMLIRQYRPQLELFRAALKRPECEFKIDFQRGFAIDTSFIDISSACVQLEALAAADQTERGDPVAAIVHLRRCFRMVRHLGATKLVETRLVAAKLRRRLLVALGQIAKSPAITRVELLSIAKILDKQLDTWPPDAACWIGDRAQVLQSYEVIRAGALRMLLTKEEVQQFRSEGILAGLQQLSADDIDRDELYYLQTMRRIIDACQEPFHLRKPLLTGIRRELHERRNAADFPILAARLFLPGIEEAQRQQAEDRARCEAWAIAIHLAAGRSQPQFELNPATGQAYEVRQEATRVTAWTRNPSDPRAIAPRSEAGEL